MTPVDPKPNQPLTNPLGTNPRATPVVAIATPVIPPLTNQPLTNQPGTNPVPAVTIPAGVTNVTINDPHSPWSTGRVTDGSGRVTGLGPGVDPNVTITPPAENTGDPNDPMGHIETEVGDMVMYHNPGDIHLRADLGYYVPAIVTRVYADGGIDLQVVQTRPVNRVFLGAGKGTLQTSEVARVITQKQAEDAKAERILRSQRDAKVAQAIAASKLVQMAGTVKVTYADGTTATGPSPLPLESPNGSPAVGVVSA